MLLGSALTMAAGSHQDPLTGRTVNDFLNAHTLIQMATDASAFAIMGVGATIVIIAGGIDLSVGAVFALSGVVMAMVLRAAGPLSPERYSSHDFARRTQVYRSESEPADCGATRPPS